MTQDESIAAVLAECLPGDQIVIHATACGAWQARDIASAERNCCCTPMVLTVGAEA